MGRGNRFLHDPALFQADFFAGEHREEYGNGNHAHAADLNQKQNYDLTENGPVRDSIRHDQARYTGCGGCGEECVQYGSVLTGTGRERQHEQKGPGGDQCNEAQ